MSSQFEIEDSLEIAEVPAGFPVGFCLLTTRNIQYVAYFDAQHRMTVASRPLDSDRWQYQVLPSAVGWDSHNYLTMAVDDDEYLHVSGNMHAVPLIYFRTEKPRDIATLKKYPMIGANESRCTYPVFMRNSGNRLIFHYRDGGSGDGNEVYNVYDLKAMQWNRLLDKPLTDGQGEMNAYMLGPTRGPDGWFHLVWVWRDTPDCATNHHLSYARSKDLVQWESVRGEVVNLPLSLAEKKLWVDPVPSGGGIINGCQKLTFDTENRPIITYHKADVDGNMQIYAARFEGEGWMIHLLTDWSKPVTFSGGGSMGFIGIKISGLSQAEKGILTMTYRHRDYGGGRLVIDEKTLRPLKKKIDVVPEYPKELTTIQSDFAGMEIRRAQDLGDSNHDAVRYLLQWETLGSNRDRPRTPPLPQPSKLRLYKLSAKEEAKLETTTPVTQDRESATYSWQKRHEEILDRNKRINPDVVIFGDSLIHYWGGEPKAPLSRGAQGWTNCFEGVSVENLGFGWDRVENVLWRILHGELDGIKPQVIIIKIGTNNIGLNTPEDIATGIKAVCAAAHAKQPEAKILLLGILPRCDEKPEHSITKRINQLLAAYFDGGDDVTFRDSGRVLRAADGTLNPAFFADDIHINATGYDVLGAKIREEMLSLLE